MLSNGQTITTALFVRMLKWLNPRLRVCSFEHSDRLAGLYQITKAGEWEDICGVDKKIVPPYASFDDGGHIVKSGWRRVFWILMAHDYTTKEAVKRVCPGFFDSRACAADRFVGGTFGDPVDNKLMKYSMESETLSDDQILDVAETIRAKDTPAQLEEREHDKWFLETWKNNGGGKADKPNY